jgi:putative integral membrane protein (TIGR02587 family)
MAESALETLRNQIRGIIGGLLVVGLPVLYTIEVWWLGWRLPMVHLVGYAIGGLVVVLVITRNIGFRTEDEDDTTTGPVQLLTAFAELVFQSFVAAYVVMFAFGIADFNDSLDTVARLGLIYVVPVGLGAAISNLLLREPSGEIQEATFPQNLPTFALGALFFSYAVAPTQEIEVIATQAGWMRLAAIVALSVLVIQLVLHELEFRGHSSRIEARTGLAQLGTTCIVYLVSVVVSIVLLASFGHYGGSPPVVWVQQTIVLSFISSTGASAGEVVL